ncbi:protein SPT2 homolog [Drosophila ficusphila]|uniref:protein SPT2 homolog n=1 Tax=Drosophila ficusphila TaxID=30025 RepID=UPI0007E7522C|nr:protein SPT2 homolog [Drosophila ficusphila]
MDFGALLHLAKKKSDAATKEERPGQGKYYSTKYAPPKKESKESKQLSNNIQKFLRKKEAEEAERKREERQKLNELLAKRDEKSKNKIRKMLKVTKSANKSVLADAKDCDGAIDGHEAGEGQGDDYGYVSNEANAFYEKYIEKVRDVQEDKGFAPSRPQSLRDLSGTKERVKAAITREREEAKSHTRQRSSTSTPTTSAAKAKDPHVARSYSTSKTLYDPEAERREEEAKKRKEEEQRRAKLKRPVQPPPMDFQALLRLAEKKQHEPVAFEPEKKKEPERLLSAREKREMEERQRLKEQRAQRDKMRESEAKEPPKTTTSNRMEPNGRIPKLNQAKPTTLPSESFKKPAQPPARPSSHSSSSTTHSSTSRSPASSIKPASKTTAPVAAKPGATSAAAAPGKPGSSSSSSSSSIRDLPSKNPYAAANKNGAVREFPPRDRPAVPSRNRPDAPTAGKTRQFPPADVQRSSGGRQFPPADVKGRRKPQEEPGNKRRIYDDEDEDEYDSELDDFIDDGDCEEDISSHIRDIFGYDKRRYRGMDDDDRGMESSFAQMQREEFISKKLGLQEDLEDMRMEAAHKKRKMAKKRSKRIDDDDD